VTNVKTRTATVIHHEVSIPLREDKGATRRDVQNLLNFADKKYRELHPDDSRIMGDQALYDDAYWIEVRDDELVAVIKEEQRFG
jgi:hypothetical protein